MDTDTRSAAHTAPESRPLLRRLALTVAALVAFGAVGAQDVGATDGIAVGALDRSSSIELPRAVVVPDRVGDAGGGIAARLHTADREPVQGDVFLLLARAGSDARARLYDGTPFAHDGGAHASTVESSTTAARLAAKLVGRPVARQDFTSAPAGGPSGGLVYLVGYLNELSDGAFTGDLAVAATGELDSDGYVKRIQGVDEKIAAADLAGVDVVFTSSVPQERAVAAVDGRWVGEMNRARYTGASLADERQLQHYREWGADRADDVDVVGVRHVADVIAYVCGAGSDHACDLLDAVVAVTDAAPNQLEQVDVGATDDVPVVDARPAAVI